MPRKRIYDNDSDRSAAYMERLASKGGARKNLILSPEAVAALEQIKSSSGEGKDSAVINRLLQDEAARIKKKAKKLKSPSD